MTAEPVRASVIVVTRERPDFLRRCLLSLLQQDHPCFEVIVVGDAAGLDVVAQLGLSDAVKTRSFDVPNISRARNVGIAAAAGEVCAFIDDDAVAEPTWLSRLSAPLTLPEVAAAGGFVRGRNGISYQRKAQWIDARGYEMPLEVGQGVTLHQGTAGRAIKTEGTNCAFRRDVLAALGGFDPAFAFYLDETDLNMRLALRGALTAIVPDAEVHHGSGPSRQRARNRAPRSLFDVGASTMVFLRKHAAPPDREPALSALRDEQRKRLLRHMIAGLLEPEDVSRLLETLAQGIEAGRTRELDGPSPIAEAEEGFLQLPATCARAGRLLSGWFWQRRRLDRAAQVARAAGQVVTVLTLSPGTRYHHMRFDDAGIWRQDGGLFGKAVRTEPVFTFWTRQRRTAAEASRLSPFRPVGPVD